MSPRLCSTRAHFMERVLPRGSPGLDVASSPPCLVPTQHVPVASRRPPACTLCTRSCPETQLSFAPRGLPSVLFSAQSETAWRALTPRRWPVGHSTSWGWSSPRSPGEEPCV